MVLLTDLRGTVTGVDSAPTISLINSVVDSNLIMGVVNTSNIVPIADSSLNLGDSNRKFKELFLSSGTLHLGDKPFKKKDILDFQFFLLSLMSQYLMILSLIHI